MADVFILGEQTPVILDTNRNLFGLTVKGKILAQNASGTTKTVTGITYDDASAPVITLSEHLDTSITDFVTAPVVQEAKDVSTPNVDLYSITVDNTYDLKAGDAIYIGSETAGSRVWTKFNEVMDIVPHATTATIILKFPLKVSVAVNDEVHKVQNTGYYEYTFNVDSTKWANGDTLIFFVEDEQGQISQTIKAIVRKSEVESSAELQSRIQRLNDRVGYIYSRNYVQIYI